MLPRQEHGVKVNSHLLIMVPDFALSVCQAGWILYVVNIGQPGQVGREQQKEEALIRRCQAMSDGEFYEAGKIVDIQLAHQTTAVGAHGLS